MYEIFTHLSKFLINKLIERVKKKNDDQVGNL